MSTKGFFAFIAGVAAGAAAIWLTKTEEGREKVFAYINDLNLTGIYKKSDPAIVVSKEA